MARTADDRIDLDRHTLDWQQSVATGVEVGTTGERLQNPDIGTVRLGPTSAVHC